MSPLAIKLGGAAVALSIAFTGGWRAKATFVDAAHAKALEAAQEAHVEALEALQEELDAEADKRLRLADELADARANVRTVTNTIIREIPNVIQDSTDACDRTLPPDFGVLYNQSLGLAPSAGGAPPAPGELAGGLRPAGGYADGSARGAE